MANWSDTQIKLTGEQTKEALKFIKEHMEDIFLNAEAFKEDDSLQSRVDFGTMEIHDISESEGVLEISGSGRWNAPSGFFNVVAEKFKLSGHFFDRECGCDFSHLIKWENGLVINDIEEDYFSQLAFDWVDIDCLIEDRSFIAEEENWEEEYKEDIELFAQNGISLEDLKERWGV